MGTTGTIAYVEKIVPDAYHGTELGRAKKIEAEENFTESRGKDYYLGDGVYFYEGSRWQAFQWAQRSWGNVNIGIIRASINLGKCLDLNKFEHRLILKKVRRQLIKKGIASLTDAVVINFYATVIEPLDTIRAPYVVPEKGAIFPESKYFDFSQLLICVRNQDQILSIRLVYEGSTYHA